MSYRVLFVDDDVAVTDDIRSQLHSVPYAVLTANCGDAALKLMAREPVDVVVADQNMPGMCGSALLTTVRMKYPDTVRLILADQCDLSAAVAAVNTAEVFRLLLKPCDPSELANSVGEALESLEVRRRYEQWQRSQSPTGRDPHATMERALGSLQMVFQPIFDIATGGVFAFEALARLEDPEVTHIGQLLGLAEALGRVSETDRAIRAAIAARIAQAPDAAAVFVNVHPTSLSEGSILDECDPLVPYANKVVYEITERSSLHDTAGLARRLDTLRKRGFRIALDDLGAGYAGLSSFALLSPDIVKFDMELIRGIQDDTTRQKLVRSLAALCKEMEILTVAEGIESAHEYGAVRHIGCDLVQGYFMGRPRTAFGAATSPLAA